MNRIGNYPKQITSPRAKPQRRYVKITNTTFTGIGNPGGLKFSRLQPEAGKKSVLFRGNLSRRSLGEDGSVSKNIPLSFNLEHRPHRIVVPRALLDHRCRITSQTWGMENIIDPRFYRQLSRAIQQLFP
jgi:hypothetical protein